MPDAGTMLKLIRKDLILNKKLILMNAVILLACLGYFAAAATRTPPRVYAGFASFMMAFLPATLITQEDKFKAMTLGCSLPVSRKAIVQARFALSLLLALTGLLLSFLFGALLPFSRYGFADLFAGTPLLMAFTGIGLVLSVLLPFTLRYGMKGLFIFLVIMQVLGIVLFTAAQLTRSSPDRQIVGYAVEFFVGLRESLGPAGFSALIMVAVAALLAGAYGVSLRIFQNREF